MLCHWYFTVSFFSRNVGNPGKSADLFLKSNNYCRDRVVRYQPTANGNLIYLYLNTKYGLCIGSKSVRAGKWEPSENERVSIEEDVCYVNNSCKLDYGRIWFCLFCDTTLIVCQNFAKIYASVLLIRSPKYKHCPNFPFF